MSIKSFLPQHFREAADEFTQALLKAIDVSDEKLIQLIRAVVDQLFLSTANGKYLMQLGEQEGFTMPANSGLDIRAYRVLVPLMVSAPKQVRRTIDEMLQAFYGTDRTRPSVTATVPEPYNLVDGDDIIVETESGMIDLGILSSQVSDITNVSAAEAAAVINTLQDLYQADIKVERGTGQRYLRFTSKAEGASAFIRIAGGTLQNVMQFPILRETAQEAGTTWNVSKEQSYTDITRFTWDGNGTNPKVFLTKPGDIMTVRGLVDGTDPLSLLNGSYEILESGYDYVIVRNTRFNQTTGTIVQPLNNTILFTGSDRSLLFDQPEYALSAETEFNSATVSVPAIPPLARRFLSGSAHLHGIEASVISFTRGSLKVELPLNADRPQADNAFVIANDKNRYDFSRPYYKTYSVDAAADPTYIVEAFEDEYSILPATTPTLMGVDSIYARPQSDEFVITTDPIHGLLRGFGFNINSATGSGNITPAMLNTEHVVFRVENNNQFVIKLVGSNGNYIKYEGVQFSNFDIYRHATARPDEADFYMQFPAPGDVTTAGLEVGTIFRLDNNLGTNVDAYYGQRLRLKDLFVVSISGNQVHFRAGFGVGPQGLILTSGVGFRDDHFGGNSTFHFDQTSSYNVENVMESLKVVFLAASPQQNPNYVGSFLYDPTGAQYRQTVSGYIAKTTRPILKGSNDNIVFVDDVSGIYRDEDFPSSGQLVIDYGTDKFEGPIKYIATISSQTGDSQIILDPSYRFKNSHEIGAQLQFIHAAVPFIPDQNGEAYPVYLTGTAQARNTLFALLDLLVAAGIFLNPEVLLPELRYQDPAIEPFE